MFEYIRPSQFFFTNMETSPLLVNGCKFWFVPCSVNVNYSIWVKNSRKGPINNGQTHENTALFSWPWSKKDALVCHTYCETVVFPMLNFSCRYNFWSSVKRDFGFWTFKANPFFLVYWYWYWLFGLNVLWMKLPISHPLTFVHIMSLTYQTDWAFLLWYHSFLS